jgi:hypothetical protein
MENPKSFPFLTVTDNTPTIGTQQLSPLNCGKFSNMAGVVIDVVRVFKGSDRMNHLLNTKISRQVKKTQDILSGQMLQDIV